MVEEQCHVNNPREGATQDAPERSALLSRHKLTWH